MASFSSIGVGLGGGVDINKLIGASVDAVKLPITRSGGLNDQIKFTEAKISAFGQVKSMVSSLQLAASKLSSVTGWNAVSASSSDSKFVSATAIGGTVETTFNVEVSQLAKAQVSTSDAIANGSAVGAGTLHLQMGTWAAGSFTAGATPGADITVSATDTVADVAGKINGANLGVTATILTDTSGQRLMLRSKATGEAFGFQMTVSADADGNVADANGLSRLANGLATDPGANAGANAKAKINGSYDVSSATNTFENAVAGVTFKAEQVTTAPIAITVAKDNSAIKKNIEDLVVAYNAVNQALNDLTKYDNKTKQAGLLQGDSTAVGLQNMLRNAMLSVSSSTGAMKSLSNIGLGMIQGGDLSIDSTKLTAALQDPAALKAVFVGADGNGTNIDGVAEKIKDATSKMLDASGFFASKDAQLKKANDRNKKEIDTVNDRAASTENLLKARYTALDSQMSKLNALNAYISQQVTTWNKSS